MSVYYQPVIVLGIDIDVEPGVVTLTGKAGSWTIRENDVVGFVGLDTCFQVVMVHPNGLTMVN